MRCNRGCEAHADCEAPYQVCQSGDWEGMRCDNVRCDPANPVTDSGRVVCPSGTTCGADELCHREAP